MVMKISFNVKTIINSKTIFWYLKLQLQNLFILLTVIGISLFFKKNFY